VLVADDLEANRKLIRRLLPTEEFVTDTACNADEAMAAVRAAPPDVILLDVRMPERDGFDLCRQLKSTEATRLIPIVLVTANSESQDRLRAIEAGADDFITKPLNPIELRARVRALSRVKRYTDELDSAEQVIVSLALTIEARDKYTDGHCQRLAVYAMAVGEALKLDREELWALQRGGYLHDVGKVGIPDAVLAKPGPLTAAEMDVMKRHPIIGERLCGELRSLSRVRPIVRHHHERLDGSGYPDGLRGDEIPLLAEIIGLVDVFDALTTKRPYRAAMSADDATRALREEVARGWRRKELVDLLLDLVAAGRLSRPDDAHDRPLHWLR
jgi:putative two-component system response regulator